MRPFVGMVGSVGLAVALSLGLGACAAIPRPDVLLQAERSSRSPAAEEAKQFAPAAFARAEKLRGEANAAADNGDLAGAQILGERTIAAFGEASALARVARSDRARVEAQAKLKAADQELGGLEAEAARAKADADAADLQMRVLRDAQAVVPSRRADPERERARLAAARALTLQARLLCGAARLLAPKEKRLVDAVDAASRDVDSLTAKVGPAATAAPIDEATRARAGCLRALTVVRREATPVAQAPGAADALLAELSGFSSARGVKGQAALLPGRDDRGVVLTLRGLFAGEALSPAGQAQIAELGKVAAAHPKFPVEVVVHGGTAAADQTRADAVLTALRAGAHGTELKAFGVAAAEASPLVDPKGPAKARNARVEVVFVTPIAF